MSCWKRKCLAVGLAALCCLQVCGCRIGNKELVFTGTLSRKEVFRINGKVCSLSEAKVFLTNYQNLYGTAYGINLWEKDLGEQNLEVYIKDLTISQLAQIMSMEAIAEEKGVELDKQEKEKIKVAAQEYYNSLNKAEKEYMDVEKSTIQKLYERYGLAQKIYNCLIEDVNEEISDDDARIAEAQLIYTTDRKKALEVEKALSQGSDFLLVAGNYNEYATVEVTFGRSDFPEAVVNTAFAMENGEISPMIEGEDGYYFFKMLNHYDKEQTDKNKAVILEQRKKAAYEDEYNEFLKSVSAELNEKLWDSITVEKQEDVTSSSFFEVFEKYW